MPLKHFNLTRAWGSRYDTLPTSPSTSFEEIQGDRQPPSQENVNPSVDPHVQDEDEKQPNASIFVGSLPSGVDPSELARLLTNHFSEYTGVKCVKVIRDSKGGVCAFVQCENTASASVFLQNLQSSPPKPFLGRILRYEPARAFRTLLISYRAPSRIIVANTTDEVPSGTINGFRDLDLPYAMRLWRPKNTKYHRIIYNAEAIEAELYFRTHPKEDADFKSERFVYLQPLKFDAESILKLTKYFGPLEKFSELGRTHELVKASPNGDLTPECYPSPHNLPRTKEMDTSCWEIKWNQRDDCVAALTALRKVPHLSVSWAHHPQAQSAEQRRDLNTLVSRAPPTQTRAGNTQPYLSPDSTSPLVASRSDVPNDQFIQQRTAAENDNLIVHKRGSVFGTGRGKNWANNSALAPGLAYKGPSPASSTAVDTTEEKGLEDLITTRIDWAEASFPSFPNSDRSPDVNWSVWENTTSAEKDTSPPSVVASRSTCQVLTPKSSQASSPIGQACKAPTLRLVTSPATPGMGVSKTPITPVSQNRGVMPPRDKTKCGKERTDDSFYQTRQLDPKALFVGGLEIHGTDPWTEEKVYATFGRFGGLEYVKFVRPLYGSAAFAFIEYNNTESPAQAILEEHNRVYGGRALKVQLRDINPPRSQWKHGRGRFSHHYANRKVMLSAHTGYSTLRGETGPVVRRGSDTKTDESKVALPDTALAHEINEYKRGEPTRGDKQSLMMTRSTEKYREWYDSPVVGSPLDPGGVLSRPATPSLPVPAPYPVPGYYPVPWPYPYVGHCQVPYGGPYPGYPFPGGPIPPFAPTPPGSDMNGPVAGSHPPWPNMVYNVYPPYFCPPPPPAVEHQAPIVPQGFQNPQGPRAPVVPSGFIQNGQGTLIAVYPPDALNQYMAAQNNDGKSGNSASVPMQPINPAAVSSAPQAHQELGLSYNVGSYANSNPARLYPAPPNPPWNPIPPPVMPLGVITNTVPLPGNVSALRGGEYHNKTGVNGPLPTPNLWKNQKAHRDIHQQNVDFVRRGRTQNENLNGNIEGVRYSPATHDWNQRSARD